MIKVVKTEPARPVQSIGPGTGPMSGPSHAKNRSGREPDRKPVNRTETGKTTKNRRSNGFGWNVDYFVTTLKWGMTPIVVASKRCATSAFLTHRGYGLMPLQTFIMIDYGKGVLCEGEFLKIMFLLFC
ncbi:hypothetical protein MTR_2g032950 [Medicago truncatula]|uniref:Uncharacterized protein n=1 Tax=Medicago truncatula TaxID=3880 RepID=G7IL17_MEDTR|nr:hypothetical protein MTR_2g032950 [Medicago truncatula]